MSQSFTLFRLQQVDSQLDKVRGRLKEIDHLLLDNDEIRKADEERLDSEARLAGVARILQNAEQEVRELRIKIEQAETALYGGKIRNPKELQELQNELAALKRYLAVLEDRQLEAMITHEEAQNEYEEAIRIQAAAHSRGELRTATLNNEMQELLKDVARLEGERSAIITGIPESNALLYEQLRKQRGGIAVAQVVDRTCSACGSTLSSALRNSAQLPNQITRCSTCNRILYAG